MSDTNQKLVAVIGAIGLVAMFAVAARNEAKSSSAPTTPEAYCAKKGANGFLTVKRRCVRRLNAGICYEPEECRLFPAHRYVPDLDSSLDIECAGDTGGSHVRDFGTAGCKYVGD